MKWGHSHIYMDFILQFQLGAAKQDKGSAFLACICQKNVAEMVSIKASFIISSEQSFIWSLYYSLTGVIISFLG